MQERESSLAKSVHSKDDQTTPKTKVNSSLFKFYFICFILFISPISHSSDLEKNGVQVYTQ